MFRHFYIIQPVFAKAGGVYEQVENVKVALLINLL